MDAVCAQQLSSRDETDDGLARTSSGMRRGRDHGEIRAVVGGKTGVVRRVERRRVACRQYRPVVRGRDRVQFHGLDHDHVGDHPCLEVETEAVQ